MIQVKKHGTPPAEIDITEPLIRELLEVQKPELARLPIQFVEEGWDNCMYRLGKDYIIRLPRRAKAVPLLENEQKWLPLLAKNGLTIPIPNPLYIGQPNDNYPWTWSILPWLEGKAADLASPTPKEALRMAQFLKTLHQPANENLLMSEVRGIPLQQCAERLEARMRRLKQTTSYITPLVEACWNDALEARPYTEKCWLHGDLHPRNVLVNKGTISGIIDWGDMTPGDRATDLACLWMLFENKVAREEALAFYHPSTDLLARAKGWAVYFGVVLLDTGLVDTPRHAKIGERTLANLG